MDSRGRRELPTLLPGRRQRPRHGGRDGCPPRQGGRRALPAGRRHARGHRRQRAARARAQRRRRLPLPVFRCSWRGPDDAGFVPDASLCRPGRPGISAVPSSSTTSEPPADIHDCNTVRMLAGDEIVAGILSANSSVFAAAEPGAFDFSLDFGVGGRNLWEYSWRDAPGSSCLGQDAAPLGEAFPCRFTALTADNLSTARQPQFILNTWLSAIPGTDGIADEGIAG